MGLLLGRGRFRRGLSVPGGMVFAALPHAQVVGAVHVVLDGDLPGSSLVLAHRRLLLCSRTSRFVRPSTHQAALAMPSTMIVASGQRPARLTGRHGRGAFMRPPLVWQYRP